MDYTASPRAPEVRQLVVPAELGGMRLDQALARMLTEHSRSRLQRWVREGRVTIDGRGAAVTAKVRAGETLRITMLPEAPEPEFAPEDIALNVVHEDASILVIDKPAGLVVHPGSGNWSGTMLNALLRHAPQLASLPRAGIVGAGTKGLKVTSWTLGPGDVMVLHSDGISRRFDLIAATGSTAEQTAHALIHRYGKSHDDASCIVLHFDV